MSAHAAQVEPLPVWPLLLWVMGLMAVASLVALVIVATPALMNPTPAPAIVVTILDDEVGQPYPAVTQTPDLTLFPIDAPVG